MTILEVLRLAWVYRTRLAVATVSGTIFYALLLYFVFPLTYISSASIYPPDISKSGGLSSILQGSDFSDLLGGGVGAGNPSQLFAEVMKSRSAVRYVISKNPELKTQFKYDNELELVQKILDNLSVEITKENILKVGYSLRTGYFSRFSPTKDSIKSLTFRVASSFVSALDSLNRKKLVLKATRSRDFFLDQIKNTKVALDSVSLAMSDFQKSNKTISLPEQVRSSIEVGAKLRAEILGTELNLDMAQQNFKEDSKTIEALRTKLDALKSQLSKLESTGDNYFLSFGNVPGLSIQYANLMRDMKMLNELYLLLHQQYYKEQIQSNRTVSTIDVLDAAIVPEKEASPRLTSSVMIASLIIFVLSLTVIVITQKQLLLFRKVN